MLEKNTLIEIINNSIAECDIHTKRINSSLADIKHILPITIEIYEKLNSDDIKSIDQLIYRYTKLQDKIGSSLIKNMCIFLEGDDDRRTFIDCLNILEKHYILKDTNDWEKLRNIRNRLTHEYSLDIDRQVEMINDLSITLKELFKIFDNIKTLFRDKF